MRFRSLSGISCALISGLLAAHATATTLSVLEEPTTNFSTPNASINIFSYSTPGGVLTYSPVTDTPLLCANTTAPTNAGLNLIPVYYSAFGSQGATPRPFVFGAPASAPSTSAGANGVPFTGMAPGGTSMVLSSDASGALVCYGLDANGVRRYSRDITADNFDVQQNSTVSVSVFQIPGVNGVPSAAPYGYTIDVSIPAVPYGVSCGALCNYALVEGYDTAVFNTSAAGAGWCLDDMNLAGYNGATSCPYNILTGGDINFSADATGSPAAALVPPLQDAGGTVPPLVHHYVVYRYLNSGVTLPNAPVVVAALFSPNVLEEDKLDDNVSVGTNAIANAAPSVVQSGDTWSTFAVKLSTLAENTDSGSLTFNITDLDTPEQSGTMGAAVTLVLNGQQVPVSTSCTLTSAQGLVPVTRQCSFDVPLNNGAFWNASVGASYDGLFNTVATDAINGLYASGVTASAQIVVTDALGKASTPLNVPLHIFSTVNNPPVVAFNGSFVVQNDPHTGTSMPTFSCSYALGAAAGGCGVPQRGSTTLYIDTSFVGSPGPAAAFDELGSQTTVVKSYSDPSGGNVHCVDEQAGAVFAASGGPLVAAQSGSGTSSVTFDMNFILPSSAPTGSVSTLCDLNQTIADSSNGFPNGETQQPVAQQFRIVVSP